MRRRTIGSNPILTNKNRGHSEKGMSAVFIYKGFLAIYKT